jgi:hypothetical protein
MTAGTAILTCSICSEPSTDICVYCTKDACLNHRCDRCKRCSDCCECDMPLSAELPAEVLPEVAAEVPAEEIHMEPPIESPVEPAVYDEFSIFAPEPEPTPLPEKVPPPGEEFIP